VMHVQVQVNKPQAAATPLQPGERPVLPSQQDAEEAPAPVQNMQYSAPQDPSATGGAASLAAAAAAGATTDQAAGTNGNGREPVNTPTVKTDWDKTPRNAPCPCGSGKKYKLCHGR
jgi:preprotein translocase subunit SecA